MSFGKEVKNSRLKAGYSIREFARKCDVSATYISFIETEKIAPSISVCCKIAMILGWDKDVLEIKAGYTPEWIAKIMRKNPVWFIEKVKSLIKGDD